MSAASSPGGPRSQAGEGASGNSSAPVSEVRPYLKRLLASILVGIVVMASTAVWAWNTYGKKLETAPPLPSGTPPMSPIPATTR